MIGVEVGFKIYTKCFLGTTFHLLLDEEVSQPMTIVKIVFLFQSGII